ncbi:AMP-binding protein, partial [Streptomyces rubiginosohelvolus]
MGGDARETGRARLPRLRLDELLDELQGRIDEARGTRDRLTDDLAAVAWPTGLRLLILGADQVQPTAVAAWRARFGDTVRLVNSYGPTETTIIATTAELGRADAVRRPPIGGPVGSTTLTVCDPAGRLMPYGAPGELLVGGAGVTLGYGGR